MIFTSTSLSFALSVTEFREQNFVLPNGYIPVPGKKKGFSEVLISVLYITLLFLSQIPLGVLYKLTDLLKVTFCHKSRTQFERGKKPKKE